MVRECDGSAMHDLRRALFDPEGFFEEASPSPQSSVGVVLAVGVTTLGLFPGVLTLVRSPAFPEDVILEAFPPLRYAAAGAEVSLPGIFAVLVASLVLMPLLVWTVYGGLFHLLSWPIATAGGVGRTLRLVAWGFLPQIAGSLVVVAALLVAFPDAPTGLWGVGATLPARVHVTPPGFHPVFTPANGVATLCTLWSGYVWAHAVAAARGVSLRGAAAVVAVPVLVSVLATPPAVHLFEAVGTV